MDPAAIAQLIKQEIDKRFGDLANRTFYRGEITAVEGVKADVKIEGSSAALPNVLCIASYTPAVGEKVLVLNIGTTGTNFLIIGKIDQDSNSPQFPVGAAIPTFSPVLPEGWLVADGSNLIVKDYLNLFRAYGSVHGVGATAKVFTVNATTNVFTSNAHGYEDGDIIYVRSTTTLPAGLSNLYFYYVINKTANTYQLSNELDGDPIDLTTTGTGTHSSYHQYKIPNIKGRTIVGLDTSQTEFDTIGETGGAKTHTLSLAEIPNATGSMVAHGTNSGWWGPSGVFSTSAMTANYEPNYNVTGGANSISALNFELGGGGGAHNNLQPYIAGVWIIKY